MDGFQNNLAQLFSFTLYLAIPTFNDPFENIVGKGKNAGNQHFLLFPQYFLPVPRQISVFESHLFFSSANAFNLDQSKILLFGKAFGKCF